MLEQNNPAIFTQEVDQLIPIIFQIMIFDLFLYNFLDYR